MKRTLVNTFRVVDSRIPMGTPINMRFANLPPTLDVRGRTYLIGDKRTTIQLDDFDMIPGRGYFFVGSWKFGLIAPWFGFGAQEVEGIDVAIAESIVLAGGAAVSYLSAIAIPGTHVGISNSKPAFYAQTDCGFTAVDDLFTGEIYEFSYAGQYCAYAGGGLSYGSDNRWDIPISWPLACRVESSLNPYFDRCSVELPLRYGGIQDHFAIMSSPKVEHASKPSIKVSHGYSAQESGIGFSMFPGACVIERPTSGAEATLAVPSGASLDRTAVSSGIKDYNLDHISPGAFANYPVPVNATLLRLRTGGRIAG